MFFIEYFNFYYTYPVLLSAFLIVGGLVYIDYIEGVTEEKKHKILVFNRIIVSLVCVWSILIILIPSVSYSKQSYEYTILNGDLTGREEGDIVEVKPTKYAYTSIVGKNSAVVKVVTNKREYAQEVLVGREGKKEIYYRLYTYALNKKGEVPDSLYIPSIFVRSNILYVNGVAQRHLRLAEEVENQKIKISNSKETLSYYNKLVFEDITYYNLLIPPVVPVIEGKPVLFSSEKVEYLGNIIQ